MADRNEEQLLSELLREVGAADAGADASRLEPRVLAAWDQVRGRLDGGTPESTFRRRPYGSIAVICALAAAVLAVLALPTLRETAPRTMPDAATQPAVKLDPNPSRVRPDVQPQVARPRRSVAPATVAELPMPPLPITQSPIAQSPITQSPITQSPLTQSPIEFVPLVPMTEHALAGSFQLVRVQMPRASLGAPASPLEHPSELVEADVLLGEDGIARGIRLSTNGSVYPWRPR